jgi:hypothetical protein
MKQESKQDWFDGLSATHNAALRLIVRCCDGCNRSLMYSPETDERKVKIWIDEHYPHHQSDTLLPLSQKGGEWIEIKSDDDLPKEAGTYLVTARLINHHRNVSVKVVFFADGSWESELLWDWEIIAWMPAPEPFDKGGK